VGVDEQIPVGYNGIYIIYLSREKLLFALVDCLIEMDIPFLTAV
jgi:hypothetical protein